MSIALSWTVVAFAYIIFHAWYVGFRPKLSAAEVEDYCQRLADWGPERVTQVRQLLLADTGREFFMVNLLRLHRTLPSGESGKQVLMKYQKPFLQAIFRRGCHPIALALAAGPVIECWGINNAEKWDSAVLVRYRSRRDFAETLVMPQFREIHGYKQQALEKTFAFVGDPARILIGGPRLVVPLFLIAVAAVASLLLG